jgi:hypothetical protein
VDSLEVAKDKNNRYASSIQTLESQLGTFRQLCQQSEEKLSIVESSWYNKYIQLSAYIDDYIRQTAELA